MIDIKNREGLLLDLLAIHGVEIDKGSIVRGIMLNDETTSYKPQFQASQSEFDLHFSGEQQDGTDFQAELKLMCIKELTSWFHPKIALECDYPEMAKQVDWSAIRDSSQQTIDKIFQDNVLPLIEKIAEGRLYTASDVYISGEGDEPILTIYTGGMQSDKPVNFIFSENMLKHLKTEIETELQMIEDHRNGKS